MKPFAALLTALLLSFGMAGAALAQSDASGLSLAYGAAGEVNVSLDGASGDNVTLSGPDSFLRIVSKAHPITKAAANDVTGLVKISKKSYQNSKYGEQYIHPDALNALESLIAKANKAGHKKTQLVETYRSYEVQQKRFDESVAWRVRDGMSEEAAYAAAHLVTALPGESEHHLGMTIDILQKGNSMGKSFAKTKFAKWLAQNAAEFGFIIRYPDNKQHVTGISYEPWHIRYVGRPLALALEKSGECLEEFYERLRIDKSIEISDGDERYAFIFVPDGGSVRIAARLAQGAYYSETGGSGRILIMTLT